MKLKRYLLTGMCILSFGYGAAVYADDTKIVLESSTAESGFSVKDAETTPNTLFRVQGDGNVGIGTTTPAQKLHVDGDTLFSGKVGIGTSTTSTPLYVYGTGVSQAKFEGETHSVIIIKGKDGKEKSIAFHIGSEELWKIGLDNAPAGTGRDFTIKQNNNFEAEFSINPQGDVSIPKGHVIIRKGHVIIRDGDVVVGRDTLNTTARIDVGGAIRIGDKALKASCDDDSDVGMMYYEPDNGNFVGCSGDANDNGKVGDYGWIKLH